jgi:hypothetical protein
LRVTGLVEGGVWPEDPFCHHVSSDGDQVARWRGRGPPGGFSPQDSPRGVDSSSGAPGWEAGGRRQRQSLREGRTGWEHLLLTPSRHPLLLALCAFFAGLHGQREVTWDPVLLVAGPGFCFSCSTGVSCFPGWTSVFWRITAAVWCFSTGTGATTQVLRPGLPYVLL